MRLRSPKRAKSTTSTFGFIDLRLRLEFKISQSTVCSLILAEHDAQERPLHKTLTPSEFHCRRNTISPRETWTSYISPAHPKRISTHTYDGELSDTRTGCARAARRSYASSPRRRTSRTQPAEQPAAAAAATAAATSDPSGFRYTAS